MNEEIVPLRVSHLALLILASMLFFMAFKDYVDGKLVFSIPSIICCILVMIKFYTMLIKDKKLHQINSLLNNGKIHWFFR